MSSTLRLLIVEDDPLIQELITELFTTEGYEVRSANHGAEALELLDRWIPDVILLDFMMPVMDGQEFRERQQRHPAAGRVPVILMSAVPNIDSLVGPLKLAASLAKPFNLNDVYDTVRRVADVRD